MIFSPAGLAKHTVNAYTLIVLGGGARYAMRRKIDLDKSARVRIMITLL